MKTQKQNYIVKTTVALLEAQKFEILSISSDYRKTKYASSKLRVTLDREPRNCEKFLTSFKTLHPSLTSVKVKKNQVTLYFYKKHTTLRKPKVVIQPLYGLCESELRLVKSQDRVEITKLTKSSLGKFFKVLKVGLTNIFVQSETKMSRTSLPVENLLYTNLKFV